MAFLDIHTQSMSMLTTTTDEDSFTSRRVFFVEFAFHQRLISKNVSFHFANYYFFRLLQIFALFVVPYVSFFLFVVFIHIEKESLVCLSIFTTLFRILILGKDGRKKRSYDSFFLLASSFSSLFYLLLFGIHYKTITRSRLSLLRGIILMCIFFIYIKIYSFSVRMLIFVS